MDRTIKILALIMLVGSVAAATVAGVAGEERRFAFSTIHVFLFNLTTGGLLVILHFGDRRSLGAREFIYLAGCLAFLAGAFFNIHPLSIGSALFLAAIVETVRWKRFAWFPFEFFQRAPVSRKFEQAALLCLSMGLGICAATLINNEYLKWFSFEKLTLHVFFLGFSFPISLTMFSLLFKGIEESGKDYPKALAEFCFWALNLGVIIFFGFIIAGSFPPQLAASLLLFTTVLITIHLEATCCAAGQERSLKLSALAFLVLGSITGIAYILVLWLTPDYGSSYVLSLHAAATLFGWNLTCMFLLLRKGELPLAVSTGLILALHWIFVAFLPLARTDYRFGVLAVPMLMALLVLALFGKAQSRS